MSSSSGPGKQPEPDEIFNLDLGDVAKPAGESFSLDADDRAAAQPRPAADEQKPLSRDGDAIAGAEGAPGDADIIVAEVVESEDGIIMAEEVLTLGEDAIVAEEEPAPAPAAKPASSPRSGGFNLDLAISMGHGKREKKPAATAPAAASPRPAPPAPAPAAASPRPAPPSPAPAAASPRPAPPASAPAAASPGPAPRAAFGSGSSATMPALDSPQPNPAVRKRPTVKITIVKPGESGPFAP